MIGVIAALHILTNACRDATLPTLVRRDAECRRVEHTGSYVQCSLGNRALTKAVFNEVRSRLYEHAEYDMETGTGCPPDDKIVDEWDSLRHHGAWCERPSTVRNLISIQCRAAYDVGVHPDATTFAINLRVTGRLIEEIALQDVLADGAATEKFWDLVRESVRDRLRNACDTDPTEDSIVERIAKADQG